MVTQDTFAQLQEEWAAKYRTPLQADFNPPASVVAALVVPVDNPSLPGGSLWGALMPTEEDAALVGKYIQHFIERWYPPHTATRIRSIGPVDSTPGINTTTFMKLERGWVTRRASWTVGPMFYPGMDSSTHYSSLLELMDWDRGSSEGPSPEWEAFKEQHGLK
jgi:hypothetical protein